MFWSKNEKNRYTPAFPSFFYIKVGFKGYTLHGHVFVMICSCKNVVHFPVAPQHLMYNGIISFSKYVFLLCVGNNFISAKNWLHWEYKRLQNRVLNDSLYLSIF